MLNGDRIRQARELCGFTQSELASAVGVKQPAIAQAEAGVSSISDGVVRSIALVTKFPMSFFQQESPADFPLGSLLYRSHADVSARERSRSFRAAQTAFELVSRLADRLELPSVRIPMLNEEPKVAARLTRAALGLSPDTPISNLISVLERSGVWVFTLPFEVQGLDAFSAWAGIDRKRPVIAISANRSGDRLRFSLAHELAHLVLHFQLRGQISELEHQANLFAGEFLVPEIAVQQEILPPVTLASVAPLKPRWRVSIQALIKRSEECGVISDRQYRYLFQQLSAKGWRKTEPSSDSVAVERPRLFRKVLEVVFGIPLDITKVADELRFPPKILRSFLENDGRKSSPSRNDHIVVDADSKIVLIHNHRGRK